jgi:hypothetical protein
MDRLGGNIAYFAVKIKVTNSVTDQKETKTVGVKADDFDAAYTQLVKEFGTDTTVLEFDDWSSK